MWQRRLTKIHFWVQSEQDQKIKRQIGYQWDNSLIFLKNKYRRRANLWNRQRIPDLRSSVKDTELLLPRTQTSLSRAQRKAGRRHRARRLVCTLPMVPCGSSPVARLYLAKKEAHEEEAGICFIFVLQKWGLFWGASRVSYWWTWLLLNNKSWKLLGKRLWW